MYKQQSLKDYLADKLLSPFEQKQFKRITKVQSEDNALSQQDQDLINYRELRLQYANRVWWFVIIWCVIMLGIILLSGLKEEALNKWGFTPFFELDKIPLTALIGSTTATVITSLIAVIGGIFKVRQIKE